MMQEQKIICPNCSKRVDKLLPYYTNYKGNIVRIQICDECGDKIKMKIETKEDTPNAN